MKRFVMAAVVAAMTGGGMTLEANEKKAMSPQEQQQHITEKLDKLTNELTLTADQQTRIRGILETKMRRKQEIMTQAEQDIRAVLGPEQVEKFNAMKADN